MKKGLTVDYGLTECEQKIELDLRPPHKHSVRPQNLAKYPRVSNHEIVSLIFSVKRYRDQHTNGRIRKCLLSPREYELKVRRKLGR